MIRALLRLMYVLISALSYSLCLWWRLLFLSKKDHVHAQNLARLRWSRKVALVLGLRIDRQSNVPDRPCILVGNHRSYLDPVVLMCELPCTAVMKAEVASWPVLGWAAVFTGILTVERDNPESRRLLLYKMKDRLINNCSVLIFPEGTSSKAPRILLFKKGAFELAAEEAFPLMPFVLEYRDPTLAWVGKDTFLPHFIRCFRKKETHIILRFGPLWTKNSGQDLLDKSYEWISHSSQEILNDWNNNT